MEWHLDGGIVADIPVQGGNDPVPLSLHLEKEAPLAFCPLYQMLDSHVFLRICAAYLPQ